MTQRARTAPPRSQTLASQTLWLVIALLAANLLYNLIATWLDLSIEHRSFLPDPIDIFADYFKSSLSFPGGERVTLGNLFGLHHQIVYELARHDFPDVIGLDRNGLARLATPPLSVTISLANLGLMRLIDPIVLYVLTILALLGYWCWLAVQISATRAAAWMWCLVGIACYPMLVMIDRGNVYAGLAGLMIVQALILAMKDRLPLVAGLCLAVAVNIRPNAIVFAMPLVLLYFQVGWRRALTALVSLGASGATICVVCYGIAHALFPGFTFASFKMGVALYYQRYAIEDLGLPYGSSLYGAVKFYLGYRPIVPTLAGLVALAILLGAFVQFLRGKVSRAALIFLTCAGYTLGSTVIADYHLIVFVLVPIVVSRTEHKGGAESMAWLASTLILAPKNFLFNGDGVSLQVVLNPLLMLAASVGILVSSAREAHVARDDLRGVSFA